MYGSKFSDLWAGVDSSEMKLTWGEKLAGFKPEAIKYALDGCDERPFPPTLPEFLGMCRDHAKRSGTYQLALPAPEISREVAAQRVEQLAEKTSLPKLDPRGWAKALRREYIAGKKLLPIQIDMASEALGEVWKNGQIESRYAA